MSNLHTARPALTPAQQKTLSAIAAYLQEGHGGPSLYDIAERIGVRSLNTVRAHRDALRHKGFVEWDDKMPRSLRIVSEAAA